MPVAMGLTLLKLVAQPGITALFAYKVFALPPLGERGQMHGIRPRPRPDDAHADALRHLSAPWLRPLTT